MTRPPNPPSVAGMLDAHRRGEAVHKTGSACIVGASVIAIVGLVTPAAQASTVVSDQVWSYPRSPETSIWISLSWAVAQTLLIVGVPGLRGSGVAGSAQAARAGLALAALGTSLILVGDLASLPVRDQSIHDTGPQIVGAVFGLGTLLPAIGFLLAGSAALKARLWPGWRRFTPLAVGVWTLALIALQFIKAPPTAVSIYAVCFIALGIALRTRPSPAATRASRARVAHGV
jgi:hypothetical protein